MVKGQRRVWGLLLSLMVWGLSLACPQETRPTLAIGAFEGNAETLVQEVRQRVVQTLALSDNLQIADRSQARALLQEQRLRESGLTGDTSKADTNAPLPSANWLLVGRIVSDETRLQIELSCLDVRTGALLTGGVEVVNGTRTEWETLAQRAAERMHRRLTGKTLPLGIPIESLPDEGVPPSRNLRDYEQSPYRWHIDYVLEKGWMRLYPDGTFRPQEPVSACYFAALLKRLQAQLGTFVAYEPSEPNQSISRGQAAILLAKLSEARLPSQRTSYLDMPDWAKGIVGWESARATPLTRERLAALLHNLMKAIEAREKPTEEGSP